jgi:hypothetical protein
MLNKHYMVMNLIMTKLNQQHMLLDHHFHHLELYKLQLSIDKTKNHLSISMFDLLGSFHKQVRQGKVSMSGCSHQESRYQKDKGCKMFQEW